MSIEDLRVSAIENDASNVEFESDLVLSHRQDAALAGQYEVAQAQTGNTQRTDRLPADQAPQQAAAVQEVVADQNNVVTLPAGTSLDDIRVEGNNLVLVQADGTGIVIVNGALNIPTVMIDQIELPQQTVFAALTENGINVAAGPDGTYSASSQPSGNGQNFDDGPANSGPENFQVADLLADTNQADNGPGGNGELFDDQPTITIASGPFAYVEANLADENAANDIIEGKLNFNGGQDFGVVTAINYVNSSDVDEATGTSGATVALTSGGVAITTQALADGVGIAGFANGVEVFRLTVTNVVTGEFTFQLFQAIDNPDKAQAGINDLLRLNFTFTVTDKDGDFVVGNFGVDVADDAVVANAGDAGLAGDDALTLGNGAEGHTNVATGSLNINWGADSFNKTEASVFGDRSVAFTDAKVTVVGAHEGEGSVLTSNGAIVSTVILADGTLVGYIGETAPSSLEQGFESKSVVFYATLSDASDGGSYTFTLVQTLDHATGGDKSALSLTFGYTATDSDGDTSSSTVTINIVDDAPVQGEVSGNDGLTEDNVSSYPATDDTDGNVTVTGGSLGISWGADADTRGENDTFGRTVHFFGATTEFNDSGEPLETIGQVAAGFYKDASAVGLSATGGELSSGGHVLSYEVSDLVNGGQTLVGYYMDSTGGESVRVDVFEITLDPTSENGSYQVEIFHELDHNSGSNALNLSFNFQGTDADGDSAASATATVTIADDAPVQGEVSGNDGLTEDNVSSYPATDDTDGNVTVTGGSLGISWGADADTRGENDTFGRTVHFFGATTEFNDSGEPLETIGQVAAGFYKDASAVGLSATGGELSSGGHVLSYEVSDLVNGGQTLVGYYMDSTGGESVRVDVFEITLDPTSENGSYQVEIFHELDHNSGSNALNLSFNFQGTDADGDSAASATATVTIADDAPVIHLPADDKGQPLFGVVEEEQREVSAQGNEDTTGLYDADSTGRRGSFVDKTTAVANGHLGISWGADDTNNNGAPIDRSVHITGWPTGLTSGGLDVQYKTVTTDGQPILTAYISKDGIDTTVFTLALSDKQDGTYEFRLFKPIDHNGPGEDAKDLTFSFTATDADGDTTAPVSFTIKVLDDVLELGKPEHETVDEDGFPQLVSGAGNPGPLVGAGDALLTGTIEKGNLNIRWGADDGNSDENGGFSGTQVNGDRYVIFSAQSAPEGLTSNGFSVIYKISNDGTTLTAYRFDGENFIGADGKTLGASAVDNAAVFKVTLADTGSGSYTFTLLDNLDHPAGMGENDIDLNFKFTASDSDGDTKDGSFKVTVDDDTPVFPLFTGSESGSVSEADLAKGMTSDSGSLKISWGADDANAKINGGYTSAMGDRYVVFDAQSSAPHNLTSNGVALKYLISDNGTTLTAYRYDNDGHYVDGNGKSTEKMADAAVFKVTLSDTGSGSYTFTLIDNLDHVSGNDTKINLSFDFKAVDGDGDALNGSFQVKVQDGGPSLGTAEKGAVDEDGLPNGNNGDSYNAGDLAGKAITTGEKSLGINWGADADLTSEKLNNGRVDDPIGRSVAFVNAQEGWHYGDVLGVGSVTAAQLGLGNLKSGGVALSYSISLSTSNGIWNGGYVLTATKGDKGPTVFTVTLDPTDSTGTYKFDLQGTLDHAVKGEEDNLNLVFKFTAIDSDGDAAKPGTFTVSVNDDAPYQTAAPTSGLTLDEDDLSSGNDTSKEPLSVTGKLNVSPGADGLGSISLSAEAATWNAKTSTLTAKDGSWKITVSSNGDYTFTLLHNTLAHTGPGEDAFNVKVDYTVTDRDGDAIGGAFNIGILDDVPVATSAVTFGYVTETQTSSIESSLANFVSFGADGRNSTAAFVVNKDHLSTSLTSLTSNGIPVSYSVVNNTLVATAGDQKIFTFTVNPLTGAYTFTQSGPIDHTDKVILDGKAYALTSLGAANSYLQTDFVAGAKVDVVGRIPGTGEVIVRVSNSGDSAVAWKLGNDANNQSVDLKIDAHKSVYVNVGNIGVDSGAVHFGIIGEETNTGVLNNGTKDLVTIIGHDSLTLDLSSAVTAVDGDGDTLDLSGHLNITVDDSTPTFGANESSEVFEDGSRSVTKIFTGLNWGADNGSLKSLTFADGVVVRDQASNSPALTSYSKVVHVAWVASLGMLVGYTDAVPTEANAKNIVFTVKPDASASSYTFTLLQPLDHTGSVTTNPYLDLTFTATATDADKDSATQTFTVHVDAAGSVSGNTIDYSHLSTGVAVNLADATIDYLAANTATDNGNGKVIGHDSMVDIVNAKGGAGDDILIGDNGANILQGNGGNDRLYGGDGDDTLNGGTGADRLDGGAGNDLLQVVEDVKGSGTRTFSHGDGESEQVSIEGLSGESDNLSGGLGYDTVQLIKVVGEDGKGFVLDRAKPNTGLEFSGIEKIVGTSGDDVILLPKDYINPDATHIYIDGGNGNDVLQGSDKWADEIHGGAGDDNISGMGGNDLLYGENGNDTIWGGDGDDTIVGGAGNDKMYGGDGDDTFLYAKGDGNDVIVGGVGKDQLVISGDDQTTKFGVTLNPWDNQGKQTLSYVTVGGNSISAFEIENITLKLGSKGDTVSIEDAGVKFPSSNVIDVEGSLPTPPTVSIVGGAGDDLIDLTKIGNIRFDIQDAKLDLTEQSDTIKLAGLWTDYTFRANGEIYRGTQLLGTASGIEKFEFTGRDGVFGYTMTADKVVNVGPQAQADNNSGDAVVEAGGVNNGDAGDATASGNVLRNDTDGNTDVQGNVVDILKVASISFGESGTPGYDSASVSGSNAAVVTGKYGTLSIHADGSYIYTLSNSKADTQALKQGDSVTETFSYTMRDNAGETASSKIVITIDGRNDAPTLQSINSLTLTDTVANDHFDPVNGKLAGSDFDANAVIRYSIAGGTVLSGSTAYDIYKDGAYGTLYLNSNSGAYSYVPKDAAINALSVNATDQFVFSVTDQYNASASQTFVVNLTAANDRPVAVDDVIITNAGVNTPFSFAASALIANDTDVDSTNLNFAGIGSKSYLDATAQNGTVTVEDTGSAGGNFTYSVTDGSTLASGTATVSQVNGNVITGGDGNEILVAVAKASSGQVTSIKFADKYDVGDVVSITVNGVKYAYTVTAGNTSAEAVYDALKAVKVDNVSLAQSLTSRGVTWPANLDSSYTVQLTGAAGSSNAFFVTAKTDNSNDVALNRYTIDFFDRVGKFDTTGSISIYIAGKYYAVQASAGNLKDEERFDLTASKLAAALTSDGKPATYDAETNTFTVDTTGSFGVAYYFGDNKATPVYQRAFGWEQLKTDDQPNPSVSNTQLASDAVGATLSGGGGNDVLFGSTADDILVGGAGNDRLTGGGRSDTFKWGNEAVSPSNADRITDFQNDDKIDLSTIINVAAGKTISDYIKVVNVGSDLVVKVDTAGTGHYIPIYTLEGSGSLTQVNVVAANSPYSVKVVQGTDPIILDLDKNGFHFSSVEHGVTFDINADGKADHVAWTSKDGILALDVNGNGKIDDGSEIFTPSFAGGNHAGGLAALATLDTNGDGKIDANDEAFSKLSIWVDANNNGISDEGEVSTLSSHGVASISLTSEAGTDSIDGQDVLAHGSFTFTDGSHGDLVEMGFDTVYADSNISTELFGTDGNDTLHGGSGQVIMTGGAGADTFVFDASALDKMDVADVITDYRSDEGDAVDVSALLDTLLGPQMTQEAATAALRATTDGTNTTVSVNTGGDTWKDVAVLQDHTTAVKILFDDKHDSVTVHS